MSSSSSVNDALADYLAGKMSAEKVVTVVAAEYYGAAARGLGPRERLKPLMEIIERAHPGVVELSGNAEPPGFGVRLAERPFPKRYEAELRESAQGLLVGGFVRVAKPQASTPRPSFLTRIVRAIRKLFSA